MSILVACRACGNEISRDAKACPKCGAPSRRTRIAPVVVSAVIVVAIAIAAKSAAERDRSSALRVEASAVPPVSVSAEELRTDYKANEVSADERYRGRVLLVAGTVRAIRKSIFDEPYVEIATSNDFENVAAHFSHAGSLARLAPGDRITVRCIGNNVVLGSPQLKDCVIR